MAHTPAEDKESLFPKRDPKVVRLPPKEFLKKAAENPHEVRVKGPYSWIRDGDALYVLYNAVTGEGIDRKYGEEK